MTQTPMNVRTTRPWAAFLIGAGLAGAVAAQRVPVDSDSPPPVPGQVLSDVQPLPAEDRESQGAVVLHQSRVRAQQGNAFSAAGERTGISSIGRNVTRILSGQRTEADMADAREAEATRLHREGAGSLISR
ncbi:MAG: hypothetical protein AVDCRST_MAG51-2494 [uncultured Ramlibacter sp.]|uniref:Uncharacterized protein n=1 Tax=uncultured Ramlibacter sp. TaxID=260755 RepID=A0A6J4Q1Y4_9BURK|nr:MAG: hypothetical protein AVDCRST_MAG51-2494 [uncultured Ramlibacter sp.]